MHSDDKLLIDHQATATQAASQQGINYAEMPAQKCLERFFQPGRACETQAQVAEQTGVNAGIVAPLLLQGACAAIEAGRCLWGSFLRRVYEKIDAGDWRAVFLCHRVRYDESPTLTRLRKKLLGSQESDTSQHGKVVQAEASIHVLVANEEGRLYEMRGEVPTSLSVVESTTAECLKRVRTQILGLPSIPHLSALASRFPWCLQQATVDRYAANFKAETSLLHDLIEVEPVQQEKTSPQPMSKLTLPCDVHKMHQAHKAAFSLCNADVSGMMSTSLSQHGVGVLHKLRQILATVLEHRLVIYYGEPPCPAHREAIYDLYLPVADPTSEETVDGQLGHMRRRYILSRTLNGQLHQQEVQHFCGPGCCSSREETLRKLQEYTTLALIPSKLPKFAVNRWCQQTAAISWTGLLSSHHNLLHPVLLAYTGGPTPSPTLLADDSLTVAQRNAALMDVLWAELAEDGGHQDEAGGVSGRRGRF